MESRPSGNSKKLRDKISEKLEEYGEAIANEDLLDYIMLISTKCRKTKEQLLVILREFFEDQTEEFVDWLRNISFSTEKKKKCKFWPNCPDEEECSYFHPHEQCPRWPKCKFGAQCLFIHPTIACKFGENCSRPNCAYDHPHKKQKHNDNN
ncbi:unnamed protein product [Blepharisma stoltei]|uniref:C3H1-type domain-containing protein n=1 Tax=Blepharisma stoltei TaxID=1481888 RepID=A0AAU9IQX3_9CILI|nr:unnamed protein product [Blepharisma stoltei]